MKLFIYIITFLFIYSGFAQSFNQYQKTWATYFGGQGTRFTSCVVDTDGNSIAIGEIIGFVFSGLYDADYYNQFATSQNPSFMYNEELVTSGYSNQTLIAKFSPNGELLQSVYLPFFSIKTKIDYNNNLYIYGVTRTNNLGTPNVWQTNPLSELDNGTQKNIIAKLNPDFSINWLTYLPSDSLSDFCLDDGKNIYGVGSTKIASNITTSNAFQPNFITEYSNPNGTIPYNNGYLFKLNDSGQLQWATYYSVGTDGFAVAYSNDEIITSFTVNNDAVLQSYSDDLFTENAYSQTPSRQIISKFNTTNGQRTYSTFLGNNSLTITHIVCYDSYYYFLGITNDILDSSLLNSAYQPVFGGVFDVYLGKFNAAIYPVWGTYVGGNGIEETLLQSDFTIRENALYFAGSTDSNNFINSVNPYQNSYAGNSDLFMMKFSLGGTPIWSSYFGGNNQEYLGSVTPISDDTFYWVGNTYSQNTISTAGSNQTNLNFHPSYPAINAGNGFIAKFSPQSLSKSEFQKDNFVLYPNPASSQVIIQGNVKENSQIEIYNLLGQKVLSEKANSTFEETINISTLTTGTYFLTIVNENNSLIRRKLVVK